MSIRINRRCLTPILSSQSYGEKLSPEVSRSASLGSLWEPSIEEKWRLAKWNIEKIKIQTDLDLSSSLSELKIKREQLKCQLPQIDCETIQQEELVTLMQAEELLDKVIVYRSSSREEIEKPSIEEISLLHCLLTRQMQLQKRTQKRRLLIKMPRSLTSNLLELEEKRTQLREKLSQIPSSRSYQTEEKRILGLATKLVEDVCDRRRNSEERKKSSIQEWQLQSKQFEMKMKLHELILRKKELMKRIRQEALNTSQCDIFCKEIRQLCAKIYRCQKILNNTNDEIKEFNRPKSPLSFESTSFSSRSPSPLSESEIF